jgi:hypothetical protein
MKHGIGLAGWEKMEMIVAAGLLFVGFGVTLAVMFFAFISGIAAGERVVSAPRVTGKRH